MISQEDLQEILEAGWQAPSGGNSQPWRFKITADQAVEVFALPEKDHPVLNFRERGTWIAQGALLENIFIAAAALGYRVNSQLFPDPVQPHLTARLEFYRAPTPSAGELALFKAIKQRATNRKKYQSTPLTFEQKEFLLATAEEIGEGTIKLIEEKGKMRLAAEAMSMNEVVMLENKILHRLFFKEVVWTTAEEKRRGGGLFWKTLELKPPRPLIFKLISHWPLASLLNKIGLAKMIAKENAATYASGAAWGAVVIKSEQNHHFLQAGRLLERFWLKAVASGLSLQLITGILFLGQKIAVGEIESFSSAHLTLIKKAHRQIAEIFEIKEGLLALVFRIGESDSPSARSFKRPPLIEFSTTDFRQLN